MSTLEQDIGYLRAGIRELISYLQSHELFWNLTGHPGSLPRLTLGGLLLASARAQCQSDQPQVLEEIRNHLQEMNNICLEHRAKWELKAAREMRTRLDLWQNYLLDYRRAPERFSDMYSQEVRWRVMLQLLGSECTPPEQEAKRLTMNDDLLRQFFLPGKYIWDIRLEKIFCAPPYWFLYGSLKEA